MRKSIVIAAGAAFAVVSATMLSCSGGQDKYLASLKNVGTVSLNAVEEYHYDTFENFAPDELVVADDGWLLLSSSKGDYNIQFLNLESGENFFAIRKGRGPGEMVNGNGPHKFDDRVVYYDMGTLTCVGIHLEESIKRRHVILDTLAVFGKGGKPFPVYLTACEGGYVSGNAFGDDYWYSYYDSEGEVLSSVGAFSREGLSFNRKVSFMLSSKYVSSPDGERVCVANVPYPVISFARIGNGTLEEYKRYEFDEPHGNRDGGKTIHNAFCHAVSGINDNLYLLYSGKTVSVNGPEDVSRLGGCGHVIEYDWDGNPLRHYVLDKEVERIAIKGDVLFGLSTYPEYRIYKFQ